MQLSPLPSTKVEQYPLFEQNNSETAGGTWKKTAQQLASKAANPASENGALTDNANDSNHYLTMEGSGGDRFRVSRDTIEPIAKDRQLNLADTSASDVHKKVVLPIDELGDAHNDSLAAVDELGLWGGKVTAYNKKPKPTTKKKKTKKPEEPKPGNLQVRYAKKQTSSGSVSSEPVIQTEDNFKLLDWQGIDSVLCSYAQKSDQSDLKESSNDKPMHPVALYFQIDALGKRVPKAKALAPEQFRKAAFHIVMAVKNGGLTAKQGGSLMKSISKLGTPWEKVPLTEAQKALMLDLGRGTNPEGYARYEFIKSLIK